MTQSNAVTLPTNVRPARYDLTLTPDLAEFTFRGQETVEIEVLQPTSEITLNSAELEILSCRLNLPDGSSRAPAETSFNEEEETATFRFGSALPVGPAKLELEFSGGLNDKLRGFYRSKYTSESGDERYLATTQFEATEARRAFPCWDEPALKARFKLTLVVPPGMAAVSNMPIVSDAKDRAGLTQEKAGLTQKEFGETPQMSTYLLAFVVGDIKSIEARAEDGTLIRVWATAGKEEQGRFALEVSAKLLAYLNDYFGIPYPLEKLDHVAIPDFAAGAMENWGAITYRENAILVDPEHSSASTRQIVTSIIAHEMAHMWFGDLVTMTWWNDLWLNESFASWMGDKAVDHLYPEWQMWTQFLSADTNRALGLDGLRSSHPIEQKVSNSAQIGELFDAISYSKGASIIRMLEGFLGPEPFRQGLHQYLDRHQHGNARTQDLWDALGESSGQPVAKLMDTWVQQTGYPVIHAQSTRAGNAITVTASQRRFLYEHLLDEASSDDTLWHVPLSVSTASAGTASVLMDTPTAELSLPLGPEGDNDGWIKVNPEQTGFYRVNYSPEEWPTLRSAIKKKALPPSDRLGLQNDAYALTKAGLLPVTQFLSLAEAYTGEANATVWEDLANNLEGFDALLAEEPYHAGFQTFARGIFRPVGARVGWVAQPGEGHLDALLRSTVLQALGTYGDEDTLSAASAQFAEYARDSASVHPDTRRVVLGLAAKHGDRSSYETMWDLRRRATLEEERTRLLYALTRFERSELLDQTLQRSLSDEVRVHETVAVIVGVGSNNRGRDMAWEFLKANWEELHRRYGDGGFALMRLVSFTSRFASRQKLEDVESFFRANPAPAAERTVRQSLERVRLNIAWLDRNRSDLAEWFAR